MGKLKSIAELNNLQKELKEKLDNYSGDKAGRKVLEGKLKGVNKQLEQILDEDNTK